jgi:hypothetical protein
VTVSSRRTLWEEGRHTGRLVTTVSGLALFVAVLVDLLIFGHLTRVFDMAFVLVCLGAALAVRPRDFFMVGVFPPLLMAGTILILALLDRGFVTDPRDGLIQAVVSGLAHHAGALVVGYVLTLATLAVRQVAVRNSGTIRGAAQRRRSTVSAEPPR